MCQTTAMFDLAGKGKVFILRPLVDLDDLDIRQSEGAVSDVLELVDRLPVKDLVLDLQGSARAVRGPSRCWLG